jgi:hypothetical protein
VLDRRQHELSTMTSAVVSARTSCPLRWNPTNIGTIGSTSTDCERIVACMSVSMTPGRIEIARKSGSVRSTASDAVSISSPALAIE